MVVRNIALHIPQHHAHRLAVRLSAPGHQAGHAQLRRQRLVGKRRRAVDLVTLAQQSVQCSPLGCPTLWWLATTHCHCIQRLASVTTMILDDEGGRTATQVYDIMILERPHHIREPATQIVGGIIAERIGHQHGANQTARQRIQIFAQRVPISAREERIRAAGINPVAARNRTLHQPTAATWQKKRLAISSYRPGVHCTGVAGRLG